MGWVTLRGQFQNLSDVPICNYFIESLTQNLALGKSGWMYFGILRRGMYDSHITDFCFGRVVDIEMGKSLEYLKVKVYHVLHKLSLSSEIVV